MNRLRKGVIGMTLGLGFALAMAMPAMAADVVEIGVCFHLQRCLCGHRGSWSQGFQVCG